MYQMAANQTRNSVRVLSKWCPLLPSLDVCMPDRSIYRDFIAELANHPALRTDQPVRPAKLFQVVLTGLFGVKPIKELNPCRWIIFSTYWGSCWRVHLAILPLVELKGYLVSICSQYASVANMKLLLYRSELRLYQSDRNLCGPCKGRLSKPADDCIEDSLDLNEYLIKAPSATFSPGRQARLLRRRHTRWGPIDG